MEFKIICKLTKKDKNHIDFVLRMNGIYSYRELAKRLEYSHTYVCNVFNGDKNFTQEFYNRLLKIGIDLSYFIRPQFYQYIQTKDKDPF